MVQSRSELSREEIRQGLAELVGESQVCVDEDVLQASSVDRFKKYQAVNGIFVGSHPGRGRVGRARPTKWQTVLRFANEHRINVVPRTGVTSTEGGLETIVEDTIVLDGSTMNEIVEHRPGQHDGHRAVRRVP